MMTQALRTIARDRRRSIALLAAAPLAVLSVLGGGWLVARDAIAGRALDQYVAGNFAGAESTTRALAVANVTDAWIYHFDRGTAMAARASNDAELLAAEGRLRTALSLARGRAECPVRYNLSLVLAWRARDTSDAQSSIDLFGEAAQIADDAPAVCDELPGVGGGGDGDSRTDGDGQAQDGGDSLGDELDDAAQRNGDSAESRARDLAGETGGGGDEQAPDLPDEDRLDELEEKLQDAQDQHVSDGWEDGGGGSSPQPGEDVARPW